MDREREVNKALGILHKRASKLGKPGSRIHEDTQATRLAKIDALRGLCGTCRFLSIKIFDEKVRSQSANLRCSKGKSPEQLYADPFDFEVNCSDYKEK